MRPCKLWRFARLDGTLSRSLRNVLPPLSMATQSSSCEVWRAQLRTWTLGPVGQSLVGGTLTVSALGGVEEQAPPSRTDDGWDEVSPQAQVVNQCCAADENL